MLTETINKIRGALGDPKAPWYGSDVVAWVGDLIEDFEKQKELLDRVCSQEPCPKCGYGVTGACYGCEIERLKAEIERLKKWIDYYGLTEKVNQGGKP